jgi:hypothetical protein
VAEDDKPRGATIHFPAPRAVGEAVGSDHDPRTAEVLRALERARGTLVDTKGLGASRLSERAAAVLVHDIRLLRDALSKAALLPAEMEERMAASTRALERSLSAPRAALTELQRRYECLSSELAEAAQRQWREADRIAAWHAWWRRRLAAWTLVLASLLVVVGALAWRAHSLAQSTHDILQQILENQAKAQSAPPGKGGRR